MCTIRSHRQPPRLIQTTLESFGFVRELVVVRLCQGISCRSMSENGFITFLKATFLGSCFECGQRSDCAKHFLNPIAAAAAHERRRSITTARPRISRFALLNQGEHVYFQHPNQGPPKYHKRLNHWFS